MSVLAETEPDTFAPRLSARALASWRVIFSNVPVKTTVLPDTGEDFAAASKIVLDLIASGHPPPPAIGYIKAWDPVSQKEVWHVPMKGSWNGGLLATAGGLVFGGGADGKRHSRHNRVQLKGCDLREFLSVARERNDLVEGAP